MEETTNQILEEKSEVIRRRISILEEALKNTPLAGTPGRVLPSSRC